MKYSKEIILNIGYYMLDIHREKPSRKTGVNNRANYRDYKEDLRDDFNSRCGYCDDDDRFMGGRRGFHIDHFAPKSKFEDLETVYSNLIYACPFCNISKSNDWPSNRSVENVVNDEGYVDPCDAQYDEHIARHDSGKIIAKSELGKYMHKKLKLHLMRHEMIWKHGQINQLINDLKNIEAPSDLIVQLYTSAEELHNLIIEDH